ncbi:MAG: hypothetical protein RLZZ308_685 [Candidatus Parcubacteria bacterium]|jgi:membrane protein YqaA with SNARE-associated domain
MSLVSSLDRFINRFAKTRYLHLVTYIVAFLEATISPVLPEAFLAVVLAYRKDISWKLLATVSALGSACGALVMYILGYFFYTSFGEQLLRFFHGEGVVEKASELFEENAFIAQFIASLTPLPDRIFSFLAGAFEISVFVVFVATFCGRFVRASVVAYLSYEYGDEAREYIKRHTRLAIIGIVFLVGVYMVYKYIF